MQVGFFLIDDGKIVAMSPSTLKFARHDKSWVQWHDGGRLERNQLMIYLGAPLKEIGVNPEAIIGRIAKEERGSQLILCSYGDDECFPFIKSLDHVDWSIDQPIVDTFYSGERIVIDIVNGRLLVRIADQSCAIETEGFPPNCLVLKDRDGFSYFSHESSNVKEIDRILSLLPYEPYVIPELLPIAIEDFFCTDAVQGLQQLKQPSEGRTVMIHGSLTVITKLCGDVTEAQNGLFLIGDEVGYLEMLKEHVAIYNQLYFNRQLRSATDELGSEARLKGTGRQIKKINLQLDKVCKKNVTIILTGESGTGKTYLAKEIHKNGRRSEGPFVNVNCAAIAYHLIESELFGYEEGSFTGAKKGGKIGYFELAKGGTLFLDEISELPVSLQGKLLEVLQEGTFYRVGGTNKIAADVRLIVATNRNLGEMVRQGRFREDLYYRINVFPIHLPPLRERVDDLYSIVEDTLPNICNRLEIEPLMLTADALDKMQRYSWPGNIRELENILEKAAVMADGNLIRPEDVVLENSTAIAERPHSMKERLEQYEKEILEQSYEQFHGDRRKIADFLGLSKTNLFEKIHKYQIGDKKQEDCSDEYFR